MSKSLAFDFNCLLKFNESLILKNKTQSCEEKKRASSRIFFVENNKVEGTWSSW